MLKFLCLFKRILCFYCDGVIFYLYKVDDYVLRVIFIYVVNGL